MRLPIRALIAVAVVAFATGASAETIRVTIKGMKFLPAEIQVKAGDVVEWSNEDAMRHTATGGDFDVVIDGGKVGSTTIAAAGAIDYKCRFHPSMKGKIVAN